MKTEKKTLIAGICSVVINLIFAFAGFIGTVFGMLFISPYPLITFGNYVEPNVYASEFFSGLAMLIGAIAVPVAVNLLLYKFWYSKCSLSKKWIYIPMAIITVGFMGFAVWFIIADGYVGGWLEATWHW